MLIRIANATATLEAPEDLKRFKLAMETTPEIFL